MALRADSRLDYVAGAEKREGGVSDSGEWIAGRQNAAAGRSARAIPLPPPQSKLRALLTTLKVLGP